MTNLLSYSVEIDLTTTDWNERAEGRVEIRTQSVLKITGDARAREWLYNAAQQNLQFVFNLDQPAHIALGGN